MEFHRAMLAAHGATPGAMGNNTTLAREHASAVWVWPWLESLWQDAAYGLRAMRGEPTFCRDLQLTAAGPAGPEGGAGRRRSSQGKSICPKMPFRHGGLKLVVYVEEGVSDRS